jgi:hypothetical protein
MKSQMTSRDYELISAYLDNQLGNQERVLLEARLKAEPELRKELHEISKTRILVHSLPKLRAPRNYFVNAEAVRVRSTLRLAPAFGIVSAVASVLLALVIFGSTFLTSTPQVAMAPALSQPGETPSVQQEVLRSAVTPVTTTEAAPAVMLGAPVIESPTPYTGPLNIGQTEIATPTTIYLYAYPPSTTPENSVTLNEEQIETAITQCEEYYGTGVYPTPSYLYNCPTPTNTFSQFSQDILLTPSPSPTTTSTPTVTSTPTPTATPSPTSTPTSTSSPTSTPTEVPPSIQNFIPTVGAESPTGITPPNQVLGTGNPTPSGQEQATKPGTTPNISFLPYILLTLEITLASIAIIAGITAIILRIRAGR